MRIEPISGTGESAIELLERAIYACEATQGDGQNLIDDDGGAHDPLYLLPYSPQQIANIALATCAEGYADFFEALNDMIHHHKSIQRIFRDIAIHRDCGHYRDELRRQYTAMLSILNDMKHEQHAFIK